MMRYELITYSNSLSKRYAFTKGDINKARKLACQISGKIGYRKINEVTIKYPNQQPGWRYVGKVWMDGINSFAYLSGRDGEGIIWQVNPKTGKLTRKIGYVE